MKSPIISFDVMKLAKDTLQNQLTVKGINNVLSLAPTYFPGATHIALSTMQNSTVEINAVCGSPLLGTEGTSAPLTSEAYTDLWASTIHEAGYGVAWRNVDGYIDSEPVGSNSGDYNLVVQSNTPQYWVTRGLNFLTTHKANIKNGDVISIFPEVSGHINWSGKSPIDQTGSPQTDYNSFWQLFFQQATEWATNNGYTNLTIAQSCNGTDVNNSAPEAAGGTGSPVSVDGVTILNGGSAVLSQETVTVTGRITADWYGWQETSTSQPPADEATYISWYKASLDYWYNNVYNKKYPIGIQEWGDTRGDNNGSIQKSDPDLTGNMADQVFFPMLASGEMYWINFWSFFDTEQEGILSADGDNIAYINAGNPITLNPKGAYLSTIFKKWYGATTTPVIPPPTVTSTSTTATVLGGLNLNGYTTSLGLGEPEIVNNVWTFSGNSKPINLNSACQWQYSQSTSYAQEVASGNALSYVCYLPVSTTTSTTTTTPPPASPIPAFTATETATVTSDGKGNLTIDFS